MFIQNNSTYDYYSIGHIMGILCNYSIYLYFMLHFADSQLRSEDSLEYSLKAIGLIEEGRI